MLSEVFDTSFGTSSGGKNEARREEVRFMSVGTKSMMRATDGMLAEIGYQQNEHALLR